MSPTNVELLAIAVFVLLLNVGVAEIAPHIASWFSRMRAHRHAHTRHAHHA